MYTFTRERMNSSITEFGLAAVTFLLVLVYFPAKPPTPPSITASVERVDFKSGLKQLFRYLHFTYSSVFVGKNIAHRIHTFVIILSVKRRYHFDLDINSFGT